jgi:Ca2+-binding RTX toxin-like protein
MFTFRFSAAHPRRTFQARAVRAVARLAVALMVVSLLPVALFTGSAQAAPAGQGFTLNASDLRFILKQIKISEYNATKENATTGAPVAGHPLFGVDRDPVTNAFLQVNNPLLPFGLRTVDGSDNNGIAGQDKFGAASVQFPRLAPAQFRDAEEVPAGFPGAGSATSYSQKRGSVFDSEPRVVSNLIVDQTSTNPAAVAAAGKPHRAFSSEPTAIPCTTDPVPPSDEDPDGTAGSPAGCVPSHQTLFIPNVTTDVGLSPPYNSWFTLFGQFFDHGVDLTSKSGGTVFVPLKADDPLIPGPDHKLGTACGTPDATAACADNLPEHLRFMALTRAKNQPGDDGISGDKPGTAIDESADDIQEATNVDSPWVDQSQTYASHSSHQVFLRHYVNSGGKPVNDGTFIEGDTGGMSTWADLKGQARTLLGIDLSDSDVFNVPMLSTDQYGRFLRGPNGFPQLVTGLGADMTPNTADDVRVEGDPSSPVSPTAAGALRIDIAFLDDIAHHAVPGTWDHDHNPATAKVPQTPDTNPGTNDDRDPGTYDDEMLDAHFMAGDGRVNENIGLTAIHQVFHSEHNRLVGYVKSILEKPGNEALLADYQAVVPTHSAYDYGERLFQAARFVTEMEYQHLVFEEFARMVQPAINPFNVFTQSSTGINPAIKAEFAHAVYRFGHSMLTDTMDRTGASDLSLLDAFLNPVAYYDDGNGGTLTPEQAAGSIAQGMTDQVGNELDEFVTETLRNNLLGLPLDLPTINMTRAREAGVPSLNNLRRAIYAETNDSSLQPYTDWVDFGLGLKHLDSLVNFMAAYGTHGSINGTGADNQPGGGDDFTPTLESRRAAAEAIYHYQTVEAPDDLPSPVDAEAFLNSTGDWANGPGGVSKTGLDKVDLWIGGLAESQNLFGGLLGSTFNYVFERQLTDLQDGDRLYYLSRTSGMNLRTQLEGNSFAELIQRNTSAIGLKAHSFDTNDCEFDLNAPTFDIGTGNTVVDDPNSECDESVVLIRMADGTIRYRATNAADPPGLNAQNMFLGTDQADKMWGGVDNDTFWGNEGDDRIEGGDGTDSALGGDGNDIITDSAGDDVHKGGDGNDAIDGGPGADIIMTGEGDDFADGGLNSNQHFMGEGDDFVIAGGGPDTVFGGGGDDWQEGGNANDLLQGDNGAPFFDDINKPGDDVLIGGNGEDDYDAEGGDDIMVDGPGIERNAGTRGYDWQIQARSVEPGYSDLNIHIDNAPGALANRYLLTEAVSGWDKNDQIFGDNWAPIEQDVELHVPWGSNALTTAGIDKIAGLRDVIGEHHIKHYKDPELPGDEGEGGPPVHNNPPLELDGFGDGNILLGGGGSDTIRGRGANDIIDGDAWLDIHLRATLNDGTVKLVDNMAALSGDVFAKRLNPGNIKIVRDIKYGSGGTDTAVYAGNRADYDFGRDVRGLLTVTHARNLTFAGDDDQGPDFLGDGSDTLRNIEQVRFLDAPALTAAVVETVPVSELLANRPPVGTVTLSTTSPVENAAVTASQAFTDADGIPAGSVSYAWQSELTPGNWTTVGTGTSFTPGDPEVGFPLRAVASYTDSLGTAETVTSAATAAVANVNDVPTGAAVVTDLTPQEGVASTVTTGTIADGDGLVGVTFNHQWQQNALGGGGAYSNIAGATGSTFTPAQAQVNRRLRVVTSFVDNHGTSQVVTSAVTGVVGDLFNGGAGGDIWTGTAGDDRAFGGGGNDSLNSGAGDDIVAGNAGNDVVTTGAGNDRVQMTGLGDGFDSVNGGAGTDVVVATSAVTAIGLESITQVEQVSAGGFASVRILGSDGNNTFNFGAVTLPGINGTYAGSGADNVTGSAAVDLIYGGGGADTINGGGGNDAVVAGPGNDLVTVTTGNDHLRLGAGFGADSVNGFDANAGGGQDLIDVTALGIRASTFSGSVTIGLSPAGGVLVTIGANSVRLIGLTNPATVTAADFILAP